MALSSVCFCDQMALTAMDSSFACSETSFLQEENMEYCCSWVSISAERPVGSTGLLQERLGEGHRTLMSHCIVPA